MKKLAVILIELIIICAYTAVYVALTEKFTLTNVLVGFAISIIALLITRKILLTTRYANSFTMNGHYIFFVFYLFFVILKSAIFSLSYIFTKDIGINLIEYKTKLKDENLIIMLANAITLTPGTVTADIKGDTIEVMKLCKLCKLDQTTGFVKIEKILKRMEKTT
ncbi:MAG: Na+/H+ antiporter subunit E [Clostridia bacterium]|jgi:multicomponent Na+:H+ antiporter subunit E|nr:Na+/H+ antiporter subunit E [Clostridia bacterium]